MGETTALAAKEDASFAPRRGRRRAAGIAFTAACSAAVVIAILVLAVLLAGILHDGIPRISWRFLTSFPSRFPDKAGIAAALVGSLWLLALTALISIPLGVGAAIWLEEYAPRNRWTQALEINIGNLAGVPSIVYGLLGLAVFAQWMGLGPSVLSGGLTLSLLVLPVVIIASREAIRAVPRSLRLAAYAVGATRWQAIRHHVVPAALPGIMTGIILAVSRAIGESAPLITMGALTYVAFIPKSPKDAFTALPVQIFNWASRPQAAFHEVAASGIVMMLVVLLAMNAVAVVLRHRARQARPA